MFLKYFGRWTISFNRTHLGDGPRDDERGLLGVGQHALGGVEEAEVGGAVDDDALHGHAEAAVQAHDAVRLEVLHQTVAQTGELALASGADVGGQPGTREVQRVDEAERGGSGGAARRQVTQEVPPELSLVDAAQEDLLVLVLEGEVERLGREVADDVGQVAAPEAEEALLARDPHEAVDHACQSQSEIVDQHISSGNTGGERFPSSCNSQQEYAK